MTSPSGQSEHSSDNPVTVGTQERSVFERMRGAFVAGLITITPAVITVWAVLALMGLVERIFGPFVEPVLIRWAERLDSFELGIVRMLGGASAFVQPLNILFSLLIAVSLIVAVGWLSRFLLFRRILRLGEMAVTRIPLLRFFYVTPKEVIRVMTESRESVKRVVLIEYPRRGIWCIAYATGELIKQPEGREMVTVFLPTTPNPTSGFLLIVPADDVHDIGLSTEDAVRMIISAGILAPNNLNTAPFAGLNNTAKLPPPEPLTADIPPELRQEAANPGQSKES